MWKIRVLVIRGWLLLMSKAGISSRDADFVRETCIQGSQTRQRHIESGLKCFQGEHAATLRWKSVTTLCYASLTCFSTGKLLYFSLGYKIAAALPWAAAVTRPYQPVYRFHDDSRYSPTRCLEADVARVTFADVFSCRVSMLCQAAELSWYFFPI